MIVRGPIKQLRFDRRYPDSLLSLPTPQTLSVSPGAAGGAFSKTLASREGIIRKGLFISGKVWKAIATLVGKEAGQDMANIGERRL